MEAERGELAGSGPKTETARSDQDTRPAPSDWRPEGIPSLASFRNRYSQERPKPDRVFRQAGRPGRLVIYRGCGGQIVSLERKVDVVQ
jgi:hypothetical protein